MDLVQTVRKEGSRGGRADFKWEDVKQDAQRENYLGHSLMAPVGRWQQRKDLNWYAKADGEDDGRTEAEKLAEEKRKLKEAEEDAMLRAMGLPVPERASTNANLTPLGEKAHEADVEKALDEKVKEGDGGGDGESKRREKKERPHKHRIDDDRRERRRRHRSRSTSRHRREKRRDRPRSRERPREKGRDEDRRRHRSRDHEHRRRDDRDERRNRHSNDRSPDRERDRHRRRRSRSPYERSEIRRD